MTAPDLSPEEKAEVARFGIHDDDVNTERLIHMPGAFLPLTDFARDFGITGDEQPASLSCEAFMSAHNLARHELAELLREYRSETGLSAFEWGSRGVVDGDFLDWFTWERLG